MYYRKEMSAAYADCDVRNLLKPAAMLRYMQQTSSEQLDSIGQPVGWLYERGMVFLLTASNICIHRAPVSGEALSIGTAAIPPKGVRFVREFVIDTPGGERLVSCLSHWVLVDTQNHKILRPSAYPRTIDWQEPGLDPALCGSVIPKGRLAGAECRVQERTMRYSHLDINAHVNNSMYADFVCDALPFAELAGRGLSVLVLNFQKEARQGDVLRVECAQISPGEYKVTGTNAGNACFEALARLGAQE